MIKNENPSTFGKITDESIVALLWLTVADGLVFAASCIYRQIQ